MTRLHSLGPMVGHTLFWGWNLLFIAVLWLGLGPTVLFGMFVAAATGMVPWPWAVLGVTLLTLPLAAVGLGWMRFRSDPGRLLSLLYGVQFPLMVLCMVRMFAIQQMTLSTGLALAFIAIGVAGLLRTLLTGFEEPTRGLQTLRLVAQSVYLGVALWVAGMALLYGTMMWGFVVLEAFDDLAVLDLLWEIVRSPLLLLWLAFAGVSMVVLAIFPFAMVGISARAWQLVFGRSTSMLGRAPAIAVTAGTLGVMLVSMALASIQPQHQAFDTLAAVSTDADRRAALEDADNVRRGLLGAFLASERWLDADPTGEHVRHGFRRLIGDFAAAAPQALWRAAMRPFVYQPVNEGYGRGGLAGWAPADANAAEAHYGSFFDVPLRRAERPVLMSAARQTWNWQDAQAGLLDAGEQRVHLHAQDITVEPEGDWARVTVHDVYRNHTWERQEVFLSFSLPDTATITGLWLGPVEDRDHAFTHVVAPRGAAQEVYKAEVQRRVDPALLEQVGPRQYRLRAFPVEPRVGRATDPWTIEGEGPDLHLWVELVVPRVATPEGSAWAMPVVAEARNLFWDDDTERDPIATWVPPRLPASDRPLRTHRAVIGTQVVTATPVERLRSGSVAPVLRVLVDGTRSMQRHTTAVEDSLTLLRARSAVTVLCTRETTVQRCPDFDAERALFWGARALEDQIRDAAELGEGPLVVLTDEASYELSSLSGEPAPIQGLSEPLWLVHLGQTLPAAYPDATQDLILSTGGGVATSAADVLQRMVDPNVLDGFRWTVGPAEEGTRTPSPGAFQAVAARRAIAHLHLGAPAGSLDHLDQVHAIAVAHSVVTPFSSMLVLVNDRQRKALEDAEAVDDRFNREVETGGPVVSSVPEPGTWLLLALGGAGLLAGRRHRQAALRR